MLRGRKPNSIPAHANREAPAPPSPSVPPEPSPVPPRRPALTAIVAPGTPFPGLSQPWPPPRPPAYHGFSCDDERPLSQAMRALVLDLLQLKSSLLLIVLRSPPNQKHKTYYLAER